MRVTGHVRTFALLVGTSPRFVHCSAPRIAVVGTRLWGCSGDHTCVHPSHARARLSQAAQDKGLTLADSMLLHAKASASQRGKKGGKVAFEQQRGLFPGHPDNAPAVREGKAKGGKNSAKLSQKCFCEKPKCAVCAPRLRQQKSHAAKKSRAAKKAREEEEQEEEEEEEEELEELEEEEEEEEEP